MHARLRLLIPAALLLSNAPGAAQQSISVGQTIRGSITEGDPYPEGGETPIDFYTIDLRAGQTIRVIVQSTAMSPRVQVGGAALAGGSCRVGSGRMHSRDCARGSADGSDTAFAVFRARTGGRHFIVVSPNRGDGGRYSLSVRPQSSAGPMPALRLSQRLTSRVEAPADTARPGREDHLVRLTAGERVHAWVESDEIAPMVVFAPLENGGRGARPDWSSIHTRSGSRAERTLAGTRDTSVSSAQVRYTAPYTGLHSLSVGAGYGRGRAGAYTAHLVRPGSDRVRGTIAVGAEVRGTISDRDPFPRAEPHHHQYTLNLRAGQRVALTVESDWPWMVAGRAPMPSGGCWEECVAGWVDYGQRRRGTEWDLVWPLVRHRVDSDGRYLAPGARDVRILYGAERAGEYTVTVFGAQDSLPVAYRLKVEPFPDAAPARAARPITPGGTVTGSIDPRDPVAAGVAYEEWTFRLTSRASVRVVAGIADPEARLGLGWITDGLHEFLSEGEREDGFVIQEQEDVDPGEYRIRIGSPLSDGGAVPYTLRLEVRR